MNHATFPAQPGPTPGGRALALRLTLATLLGLAVLASATPAGAQGYGSPGTTGGTGASGTAGSGSASGSAGSAQRSQRGAEEDREMVDDLVHASLAEIETGRLALEKTQNPQVRSFAQQMIDDHTRALQELQQLGQKKQMTLPTETDFQHKAIATALRILSGDTFDRQYIRQVGVNDHRRTVDLLMKMQQTARDPELKAQAGKMLPVVQRHLAMAREMDQKMR